MPTLHMVYIDFRSDKNQQLKLEMQLGSDAPGTKAKIIRDVLLQNAKLLLTHNQLHRTSNKMSSCVIDANHEEPKRWLV